MPGQIAASLLVPPDEANQAAQAIKAFADEAGWNLTGGEIGLFGKALAASAAVAAMEGPRVALFAAFLRSKQARPIAPASPQDAMSAPVSGEVDLSGLV